MKPDAINFIGMETGSHEAYWWRRSETM